MKFKIEKDIVKVVKMNEAPNDRAFWLSKSWEERLSALESLRQQFYNYTEEATPRLQRVITVKSWL